MVCIWVFTLSLSIFCMFEIFLNKLLKKYNKTDTIMKINRQVKDWEKTFIKRMPDKGLVVWIYKNSQEKWKC